MRVDRLRRVLIVWVTGLALLPSAPVRAQQQTDTPAPEGVSAADHIANAFSQLGDQIYDECIFELSEEQLEVQQALIQAYVAKGASSTFARQLAVRQIQPPKLSEKCEEIRNASQHGFRGSGGVPEWLKGTDCKSVGSAYVGSNPTPSTILLLDRRPAGIAQW